MESLSPVKTRTDQLHAVEVSRSVESLDTEPDRQLIISWVIFALSNLNMAASEVSLQIVDEADMTALNAQYRNKAASTNVLSFPSDIASEDGRTFLGDIVICNQVVKRESLAFNKRFEDRYAHMVIHGLLHLIGHDHGQDDDRLTMEQLEIDLLEKLGMTDPYEMVDEPMEGIAKRD